MNYINSNKVNSILFFASSDISDIDNLSFRLIVGSNTPIDVTIVSVDYNQRFIKIVANIPQVDGGICNYELIDKDSIIERGLIYINIEETTQDVIAPDDSITDIIVFQ
jgi:hypothetical protein